MPTEQPHDLSSSASAPLNDKLEALDADFADVGLDDGDEDGGEEPRRGERPAIDHVAPDDVGRTPTDGVFSKREPDDGGALAPVEGALNELSSPNHIAAPTLTESFEPPSSKDSATPSPSSSTLPSPPATAATSVSPEHKHEEESVVEHIKEEVKIEQNREAARRSSESGGHQVEEESQTGLRMDESGEEESQTGLKMDESGEEATETISPPSTMSAGSNVVVNKAEEQASSEFKPKVPTGSSLASRIAALQHAAAASSSSSSSTPPRSPASPRSPSVKATAGSLTGTQDDVVPSTAAAPSEPTPASSSAPPDSRRSSVKPVLAMPEPVTKVLNLVTGTEEDMAEPLILGIAVVDFNHLVGPQVEYAHPVELAEDEELCKALPFMALPDGAHLSDEDYCYFHLMCPALSPSTIFGISCNRQIASDELVNKGKEVTRSTVQKAIVVLAREPVFGPIRDKLGVVTRAFFAQGDLNEVDILVEFHASLEASLRSSAVTHVSDVVEPAAAGHNRAWGGVGGLGEGVMYMGTSIRELIYKFRFKTLILLKLLLLQKKVMFYGYPIERLCTYQYSLVSLVPGLLLDLGDAAAPDLDRQSRKRKRPTSLRTSDRRSLLNYLGLPLCIFGKGAFFQPYCPLQQIDMLQCESFLVGTSNSIFQQQKDCEIDVLVQVDQASLEFADPKLSHLCALTAADRKWMDELVQTVSDSWNPDDPTRPTNMQFIGSDDYLRGKFEEYISSALSSIKYADFLQKGERGNVLVEQETQPIVHFNEAWVAALRQTRAFSVWEATTDEMIFDICDPRHPCEGKVSTIEDVGLRLAHGLHDLNLQENLAPTREAVSAAIQTGSSNLFRFAQSAAKSFGEQRERLFERSGVGKEMGSKAQGGKRDSVNSMQEISLDEPSAKNGGPATVMTTPERTPRGLKKLSLQAQPTSTPSTPDGPRLQQSSTTATTVGVASPTVATVSAQAAAAGAQVRTALGQFGSFLSAKRKELEAARAARASLEGGGGSETGSEVREESNRSSESRTSRPPSTSTTGNSGSWVPSVFSGSKRSSSASQTSSPAQPQAPPEA